MNHAYPSDEIRPISCRSYDRVSDIMNINRNDVLGNYSVTFIDTLTTFAIMGDVERFSKYIEEVRGIDFNSDATVQVFETTIRTLGSLISCHLYASDEFRLQDYDGFLLEKAKLLGDKLLSSYRGKNGLPLPRINLNGDINLPLSLVSETCTAGAASPMLELTLLSILTNDTKYEDHSKTTFFQLWNSRSELDLVPMTLDPVKGVWLDYITGIGASIDSFYEYALKGSILFNDDDLGEVWVKSIKSLSTHSKLEWFFPNVDISSGMIVSPWIDSLSAFFPGLLVLAGKVEEAIKTHEPFIKLWNQYSGIPERWDFFSSKKNRFSTGEVDPIELEWYPLRPEFIESTYYLYRATSDPLYLRIGEKVLKQYQDVFKVQCGFSGFRDVRTKKRQDRMESFVLSETLMYLYLLFDEDNNLNHRLNFIFSTEGHPFWIPGTTLSDYNEYKLNRSLDQEQHLVSNPHPRRVRSFAKRKKVSELLSDFKNWNKDELLVLLDYVHHLFGEDEGEVEGLLPEVLEQVSLSSEKYGSFESTGSDICEVFKGDSMFFSNVLNHPSFFLLDSKFRNQWNYSSHESIELESSFYEIYGSEGYCFREPSVGIMDYMVGNSSYIRNEDNVEYYTHDGKKDIWVHSLDGLRLKLELLKHNSVDSQNVLIEKGFILEHQGYMKYELDGVCSSDDEKLSNGVLQVKTINGLSLQNNTMVYIAGNNLGDDFLQKNSISFTENGHLVLQDLVVSNMKTVSSLSN
jgi:hypothetical protein